jgi:hypothetical protein
MELALLTYTAAGLRTLAGSDHYSYDVATPCTG